MHHNRTRNATSQAGRVQNETCAPPDLLQTHLFRCGCGKNNRARAWCFGLVCSSDIQARNTTCALFRTRSTRYSATTWPGQCRRRGALDKPELRANFLGPHLTEAHHTAAWQHLWNSDEQEALFAEATTFHANHLLC